MDNSLYELIVARQSGLKTQLLKILLITFLGFFGIVTLIFLPPFFLVPLILSALAYFFVFPKFFVEYEYTLIYQELDIDIIYKKAKRKSLMSLDLREVEIIAPVTSNRLASYRTTVTLDYSARNSSPSTYAIVIPLKQSLTKILVQPDEGMINHLRNNIPRNFFTD